MPTYVTTLVRVRELHVKGGGWRGGGFLTQFPQVGLAPYKSMQNYLTHIQLNWKISVWPSVCNNPLS